MKWLKKPASELIRINSTEVAFPNEKREEKEVFGEVVVTVTPKTKAEYILRYSRYVEHERYYHYAVVFEAEDEDDALKTVHETILADKENVGDWELSKLVGSEGNSYPDQFALDSVGELRTNTNNGKKKIHWS